LVFFFAICRESFQALVVLGLPGVPIDFLGPIPLMRGNIRWTCICGNPFDSRKIGFLYVFFGNVQLMGAEVTNLKAAGPGESRPFREADRAGFEPAVEPKPYAGLANRCLQPLGHLSL
jgi:hypothetical protein